MTESLDTHHREDVFNGEIPDVPGYRKNGTIFFDPRNHIRNSGRAQLLKEILDEESGEKYIKNRTAEAVKQEG